MKHTEQLRNLVTGHSTAKLLEPRAMGKFYTHPLIATWLAEHIIASLSPERITSLRDIYILDPFCGDGRLLAILLEQLDRLEWGRQPRWHVEFWDYDESAVQAAYTNLSSRIKEMALEIVLKPAIHDSLFVENGFYNKYEVVVTNPPWETIKPDRRELSAMSAEEQASYFAALRQYDVRLAKAHPHSQPTKKFAGWGTNLSRCGVELSLKLTTEEGVCGIVTPLSLLTDQTSRELRAWLFSRAHIQHLAYYPAEAKLFSDVDQESVAFVLRKSQSDPVTTSIVKYNRHRERAHPIHLTYTQKDLAELGFALPVVYGETLFYMSRKWSQLDTIQDLETDAPDQLWLGRELDETSYRKYLSPSGRYAFVKGRMIGRFSVVETPKNFVREDIKIIPSTVSHERLVWRDISRPSQIRRMQAAIIPPGWVTGNSLHVAYFRSGNTKKLRALLSIMNSLPFEFQVRARLGTGHISLGAVRQVRIPALTNQTVDRLSSALAELEIGQPDAEIKLEILVARAYKLNRDEFKHILQHFSGLDQLLVAKLLASPLWEEKSVTA